MTLDGSGNVLVGKATTGVGVTGVQLSHDGSFVAAREGAVPVFVNRKTDNGELVRLLQDGTIMGSIGSNSSSIYAVSGDTGILLYDFADEILPFGTNTRDAAISLGRSTTRFKDLYLSGGVYLGGTGSANRLDDYEIGAWTPYLAGATGITYTVQNGTYVKSGDLVALWWRLDFTGTMGGSNIRIAGRPFYQYTHDTSMNIGILGSRSALNVGANDTFFPAMYGTADAIYIYNPAFAALNYTSVWQAGSLTGTLTYRAN
jgi:hypothetical protein